MAKPNGCTPAFLGDCCLKAGFQTTPEQAGQLSSYLTLLMQWNRVMNLVGARHWRDALDDLVMDSFHLNAFLRSQVLPALPASPACWDLGSGAGLPGIPLRILWNEGDYWMVESRDKRTIFLSTVLARSPIPGTHVFHGRAEQFMDGKKADLIVSRAFMPWKELLEFIKGHLNPGGQIVFLTLEELKAEEGMDWISTGHTSYKVGKDTRHFCAFAQKQDGRLP
ncbi:MAG: 16S rRNA (guanine(527)-N(7))-methyltransferase RsmG [Mailhella sp.]|nr:16S rRNA (guanine(527)-N(7))-methyltransferase RsmG [Mailhella sp.]